MIPGFWLLVGALAAAALIVIISDAAQRPDEYEGESDGE